MSRTVGLTEKEKIDLLKELMDDPTAELQKSFKKLIVSKETVPKLVKDFKLKVQSDVNKKDVFSLNGRMFYHATGSGSWVYISLESSSELIKIQLRAYHEKKLLEATNKALKIENQKLKDGLRIKKIATDGKMEKIDKKLLIKAILQYGNTSTSEFLKEKYMSMEESEIDETDIPEELLILVREMQNDFKSI
jgi:hypothetical protein